jgi:hypothetical protein
MRVPLTGRMLLRLFVPRRDHEYVAGDLHEEYARLVLPALGEAAARRWYVRQALRSVWPFLLLRLRRGELSGDVLGAQLLVVVPLIVLHALWTFVLSQVPLRASVLAPGFEVASVAALGVCALLSGAARELGASAARAAVPGLVFSVAVLAVAVLVSPLFRLFVPPAHVIAAFPLGVLAGSWLAVAARRVAAVRVVPLASGRPRALAAVLRRSA